MSYATLGELKTIVRVTDATDDDLLQLALDASSDLIDGHCNRTFVAEDVASARSFTPSGGRVDVDDIYTADGLIVSYNGVVVPEEVENVSAGYRLLPDNAAAHGEPYTEISNVWGDLPFTWGWWSNRHRVTVTAKWGYAAEVPPTIKQACLLQSSRLFARRNSPFGIAGSPDMGSELRLLAKVDPDVAVMLTKFVRLDVE